MQIFIEEFLQKRAKSEKLHGNGEIADLVLKLAVMDVEHFARAQRSDVVTQLAYRTNDVRQVLTVGIRQEDLAEPVTAHKAHNARDTLRIQLVEDIVKEKDWFYDTPLPPLRGGDGWRERLRAEVERLGEFEGNEIGFLLSLAAYTTQRVIAQQHLQLVLVHTL